MPRRTSSTSARSSRHVEGNWLICRGILDGAHGPVALPVMQGPKARHIFCPLAVCRDRAFLSGTRYTGDRPGYSLAELRKAYPKLKVIQPKGVEAT